MTKIFAPGTFILVLTLQVSSAFAADPCEEVTGKHRLHYRPEGFAEDPGVHVIDFDFKNDGDLAVDFHFFDEVQHTLFSLKDSRFWHKNARFEANFLCRRSYEDCERIRDDSKGFRETLLTRNYVDAKGRQDSSELREKIVACAAARLEDVAYRAR